MLKLYGYSKVLQGSELYKAKVFSQTGEENVLFVHENIVADFTSLEFDEKVTFEITVKTYDDLNPEKVSVHPTSRGIHCVTEGKQIFFTMDKPQNIKVAIEGMQDLFIYCAAPENGLDVVNPDDPNVFYYEAGQIYDVGKLELASNQTLYIEGGAVLFGRVYGIGDNIRVLGRGIIDGGYALDKPRVHANNMLFENCTNLLIKDVTSINPMSWMTVLGNCDGVLVQNIRELGYVVGSDGVDVCGSRNVLIEDCMIKNNDDCIVIKSFVRKNATQPWDNDVINVVTRNCAFQTLFNGAIMEIGHELITEKVEHIVFENCDVMGTHGFGSVFSIRNCDYAFVSDVLYKDIRIEHCYDQIFELRVMESMWSKSPDKRKGQVRNVRFENIYWSSAIVNVGYTTSLIGGHDKDHTVEDVSFKNFYIDGKKIKSLDELNIFYRYSDNVRLI
ncbi:MAG: glycosyl hydrolase family 28 protein [Clostridia bacterium]